MDEEDKEARVLQEERFNLEQMKQTLGYKSLMEYAESQIQNRLGLVLRPVETLNDVPASEFAKGEIAGIKLFTKFADILIRTLTEQIDEKLPTQETDENVAPRI